MTKNRRPEAGRRRASGGQPPHSPAASSPAQASALLAQAVGHHQAGRYREAEEGYRAVLKDAPNNPDALHLSGVLALQMGQPAAALELIGRAIARLDGVWDFHDNHGNALAALGRHAEAAQAHRHAARLRPDAPAARFNLGNALQALEQPAEAVQAFRAALILRPDYAKAWYNLGNALRILGHAGGTGRTDDAAIAAFARAVTLAPAMAEARTNLGDALAGRGRLDAALAQHRAVVALRPEDGNAHYNLGAMLQQRGAFESAELAYREAIRHAPRHAAALNNLGSVLKRLGRHAQAEQCHRKALELRPDFPEARYNLGNALQAQGKLEEAASCFEAALSAEPGLATASFNLSLLALRRGDLGRGWLGYDRRFAAGEARPDRRIGAPLWTGELLKGRRLLIWREQGVGDEILFASCYADVVEWAGGPVTIEADRRLVPLLARSFPGATIRAESAGMEPAAEGAVKGAAQETARETINPPDCDLQIPAGSLPRLLREQLSGFTPQPSWLVPDPAKAAHWRERLAALGPGLKVGIGWRSQLMTAERRAAYTNLEDWAPLFRVPGLVFVNLQYGDCAEEIERAEARFGVRLHRWADLDLKDDFEAAAALASNLDLVISPAMSAGELAGALGVPVWRFGGRDWTQLGTGVRPWFPSMRLWQPRPGEALPDVLARMARDLGSGPAQAGAAAGTGNPPAEQGPFAPPAASAVPPAAPSATPPDIDGLLGRAMDLHRQGRLDEAAAVYRAVLDHAPDHPDALHLLGLAALQSGRHDEAVAMITAALRRDPDFPQAWNHLGLAHQARDRHRDARSCFARALATRPNFGEALTHLGLALHKDKAALAAARRWHRRSVATAPDNAAAHTNLGHAHELEGRFAEAATHYRRALALRPDTVDPHNNLGTMARAGGDAAAAQRHLRRALRLDPGHGLAGWNHGLLRLAAGDLETGWTGYEQRAAARVPQGAGRPPLPLWTGEPLEGRRLILRAEQGIGDEILFASCYGELERLDGEVVMECDRRLVPLFRRAFPWATVRAEAPDTGGTEADLQMAAGSLPALLRRRLDRFPARTAADGAYLTPEPERAALWRERVAALGPGLKVGIGWRSQVIDAYRAASYTRIEQWRPLFDLPGLRLVNLQYDDCAAEIASVEQDGRTRLHRWPDLDLKDDFEGTAALIANLDLVIVAPTSTGELAGALGVPVWRLGGRDWTHLGTAVRPWFPSMRMWQPRPGENFGAVIARIARVLAADSHSARRAGTEQA
ncbi:tetratricopeptide repeat protein [Azospirillum sp. SYSU D00513]|uniref:tetratricopeptide repeat protein n=1 Tax=Azospirillum sp. SYSU D00513 TaxID=2812561 RepID=UPI001A959116|nr:tetratricopeptide repeat protein [Azospirillum sp. SYSU D00513]